MIIVGILLALVTIFVISKHEEFRIKDEQDSNEDDLNLFYKKQWHLYKGIYQLIIAMLFSIAFNYKIGLLFCIAFTIFQDAHLNKSVFKRPVYFEGQTAWLDVHLRKLFKTDKNVFIFKIITALGLIIFSVLVRV